MVIEVGPDLAILEWNDRAARALQISREAARGRFLADLLPIDGGEAAWRSLLAATDDAPRLVAVEPPQLGRRHLEIWSQPAEGDAPAAIYAHDVSARVARERQLQLESTVLGALEATVDVSLWAVDHDGTYLYQDGLGLKSFGMDPGQLIGENIFDQNGGRERLAPIVQAIAGEPYHIPPYESRGVFHETWFVPVREPGCAAQMVGITLNVTEIMRREQELRAKLELIEHQREVIRELSTPIIEVWDGVLALPIVGLVDSVRTAELMDNLLQAVSRTGVRFAVLDLTGVQVVDTSTASHLIGLIRAIGLLGAEGVLTGIHPNIAQTIVNIGVDLAHVRVFGTLRDALEYCIARMNPDHT